MPTPALGICHERRRVQVYESISVLRRRVQHYRSNRVQIKNLQTKYSLNDRASDALGEIV
jgi:hypothetical protein